MSSYIFSADSYRRLMFALMACMTMSSMPLGMPGTNALGMIGTSLMCCMTIWSAVSPSNGSLPVSISYIITPSEYRSVR